MFLRSSAYKQARRFRVNGKSYSEIHKLTGISKGTLHNWFSKETWSSQIKEKLLKQRQAADRERLLQFAQKRSLLKTARYNSYRTEARTEYKKLKKQQLFLLGLAIYWGEGEKAENGRVAVINSDISMLKVIVKFFTQVLKVSDKKIRATIFIYKDISSKQALSYWSRGLGIPFNQFVKIQILPSRKQPSRKKLSMGICNVYFSDTKMHVKVLEWIKMLGSEMRT